MGLIGLMGLMGLIGQIGLTGYAIFGTGIAEAIPPHVSFATHRKTNSTQIRTKNTFIFLA
jgi:hypothetical protein